MLLSGDLAMCQHFCLLAIEIVVNQVSIDELAYRYWQTLHTFLPQGNQLCRRISQCFGEQQKLPPDLTINAFHALNRLARLFREMRQYHEAQKLYELTLVIAKAEPKLGDCHVATLVNFHNLGNVYCELGQYDRAEIMLFRALQGFQKKEAIGEAHTRTLSTTASIGYVYFVQGKQLEAETMLKRALDGYGKCFSKRTLLQSLKIRIRLAKLYAKRDASAAETMFLEALTACIETLSSDYSQTITVLVSLALLYMQESQYRKAASMLGEAIYSLKRRLGNHPPVLQSTAMLDNTKIEQGILARTQHLYLQALQCCQTTPISEGPFVQDISDCSQIYVETRDKWNERWRLRAQAPRALEVNTRSPKL